MAKSTGRNSVNPVASRPPPSNIPLIEPCPSSPSADDRRTRPAPPCCPVHPGRLGPSRRNREQRHRPGADAGLGPADGDLPARARRRFRTSCRAAGRPDGQFRGRPYVDRRRPGRAAGSAEDRRGGRRRLAGRTAGPRQVRRGADCLRRHRPCHGPAVAGRRPFPPEPYGGCGESPCLARRTGRGPRLSRRPGYPAAKRGKITSRTSRYAVAGAARSRLRR